MINTIKIILGLLLFIKFILLLIYINLIYINDINDDILYKKYDNPIKYTKNLILASFIINCIYSLLLIVLIILLYYYNIKDFYAVQFFLIIIFISEVYLCITKIDIYLINKDKDSIKNKDKDSIKKIFRLIFNIIINLIPYLYCMSYFIYLITYNNEKNIIFLNFLNN